MKKDKLKIRGAKTHNLKGIDLEIPKGTMTVFTGVSGSGKSSLAFDTIFAEGQRRYIDSLSPYARQFLGQMDKPDVDDIEGLSPAIAINQKAMSHNPRSIVATLTEIFDFMRVLWARSGKPFCPRCGNEIRRFSSEEMFNFVVGKAKEMKSQSISVFSPVVRGRKGEYYQMLYDFLNKGFSKARIDGNLRSLHERIVLSKNKKHDIETLIDILDPKEETRLFEAIELALSLGGGLALFSFQKKVEFMLSSQWSCLDDGFSFHEMEPRIFSFNSPYGACSSCHGLGKESFHSEKPCPSCSGKRLKKDSLSVKIKEKNIWDVVSMDIASAHAFFSGLENSLSSREKKVSERLVWEISTRLEFLLKIGLDYIKLSQEASTLSRGEAQRIRLASQIGSKLSGALYVLDEPTIGLHERDNERLVETLKDLKDIGNTVIVVEHDERVIKESDYLVDLGPGAGIRGGLVVAAGKTDEVIRNETVKSLTLDYLRRKKEIGVHGKRTGRTESLKVIGARMNNLKNIDVEIPLRKMVCISGVSGSGKSSLLEVIYRNAVNSIHRFNEKPVNVSKILGTEYLKRIVEVNQNPIGKTPRSNPATYTGVFTPIRDFFSGLEEARKRGYSKSRFSFNISGGRCESCKGAGSNLVEMHFLPPVLVRCDVCKGRRFNREILEVKYKNKNIFDVLEMTVDEVLDFFEGIHFITDKIKVLRDIGLGYIKLGQNAPTLSGGEAQRVKLAKEIAADSVKTLYMLDEPTTGLHYHDINLLIKILRKLIDRGNSIVVIEHNLHFIRASDWVVDLGPEGGAGGGKLIAAGSPEEIAGCRHSHTGAFLKSIL